ncbi:MAG: ribonuclease HII, partial [Rhodospirillales bacterium]|nr:ribonuclease HII [Rhodospirillales bacterium]
MPDYELETEAGGIVCGVDEAGRGPWAGPVVAGAAILDIASLSDDLRTGLDDSKKLKATERERLFALLQRDATLGIGIADVDEIDRHNILQATLTAMARAVANLEVKPGFALIDGNKAPILPCPARPIIRG